MIGIFDSGFGGLAIFKEIVKTLPDYNYMYLGDSARTPYGGRSQEVIYKFTEQAVDFLFKQGCELVIIACGTASADALHRLQREYLPRTKKLHSPKGTMEPADTRRVLGIIRPLVEEAVGVSRFGRIGVVGTRSTVESGAYEKELKKVELSTTPPQPPLSGGRRRRRLEVFQQACPLLVPLIEEGWTKKPETKMILKKYLRPLKEKKIDTLILGCTHYPLIYKEFVRLMGKNCLVLDSGKIVAESLKDYLARHGEIEVKLKADGLHSSAETMEPARVFYTTDDPGKFSKLGGIFFGEKIIAEKVEV